MAIALILAAGSGERLGAGRPKAFVELAGRPLVQWSVDVLRDVVGVQRIVIALPPGARAPLGVTEPDDIAAGLPAGAPVAVGVGAVPVGVTSVEGGAVRSQSVRLALSAAGGGSDREVVLVHDAARPLLSGELAAAAIRALEEDSSIDAAIAAVPMTDTVKRVTDGVVRETLDRSELWAVQTPQVFRRAALERALEVPEEVLAQATDDAWLVERAGGQVGVVEATSENLKITTPLDLAVAEMLIAARTG